MGFVGNGEGLPGGARGTRPQMASEPEQTQSQLRRTKRYERFLESDMILRGVDLFNHSSVFQRGESLWGKHTQRVGSP
jgi:hypothetical protein